MLYIIVKNLKCWFDLAQKKDKWLVLVNTVTNFQDCIK